MKVTLSSKIPYFFQNSETAPKTKGYQRNNFVEMRDKKGNVAWVGSHGFSSLRAERGNGQWKSIASTGQGSSDNPKLGEHRMWLTGCGCPQMLMPSQLGKLGPVTKAGQAACIWLCSLGYTNNKAMRLHWRPAISDSLSQGTVISETSATGKMISCSDGNWEPVMFPVFFSFRSSWFKRSYVFLL